MAMLLGEFVINTYFFLYVYLNNANDTVSKIKLGPYLSLMTLDNNWDSPKVLKPTGLRIAAVVKKTSGLESSFQHSVAL